METENNTKQKVLAAFIVIAAVVLATVYFNSHDSHSRTALQPATDSTTASVPISSPPASGNLKDGTYSATTEYYVPHGTESIKVTLTLQNGTITDSQIENSEYDRESVRYQEAFAEVYKSQVVGKSISGLRLSNVAGASDTAEGFSQAVNRISNQASVS